MFKYKIAALLLFACAMNAAAQNPVPTPQWRPVYHFTPPQNWTNDPNGLIYLNGEFQLYYQHNPYENKWGHMSWGHATSTDLVHWKNHPVAIHEVTGNDTTIWIYSGSAVLDKDNTSGFGVNGKPPLVAIFTADLPKQKKETQCLAYSNDGGLTYKLYKGNPVIDINMKDFRDPNVFWYAPTKQWIMTVAMCDEHLVRIYGSKNLKQWTKLSDFGPAGFTRNQYECPSLLPLMVDGNPNKIKWVITISTGGGHGPMMQYFVGDFDGVHFKNDNPADKVMAVDYGDVFYAAIAYRNAPGGKPILLGWLQNGKPETYPWKGQMAIPHDLSLKTTPEGLVMVQAPTAIIGSKLAKYAKATMLKQNIAIKNRSMELSGPEKFDNNANWIEAEFKAGGFRKAGFTLTEKKGTAKKVIVGYDAVKQEIYIDCSGSESANKPADKLVQTAPMKPVNGVVKIQVLLDKSSLEVFGNGGEKVISTMIYPDTDATGFSLFSEGAATVKSLKVWDLGKK